jgi:ADP-ribosyl-[dinitrogen reductase] hydrolase
MIGGGPFNLEAGQWTDDTAMALAMGEALIQCGEFRPHAIMNAWVDWYSNGTYSCTGTCFDIGGTTSASLHRYMKDGDPYAGSTDEHTAGNGSLMRLAPVVIRYMDDPELSDYVTLSSIMTHAERRCVRACAMFAERLVRAYRGESKQTILAHYNGEVGSGTGYVVDAYHTALMCFAGTDNFRDAILMAANLGHDADTSAAITGQLAGAYYGIEGIPVEWLDRVAWRYRLLMCADELYQQGQVDKAGKPVNVD